MDEKLELKDGTILLLEDIKNVFQELYDHYRSVVRQNEYLREENKKIKEETYKDEELSKMKKSYDEMKESYYRGFPISEKEEKVINKWIDEQRKNHPANSGAIGGRFKYEFISTSVGTIGTVVDGVTGEKLTFQEP